MRNFSKISTYRAIFGTDQSQGNSANREKLRALVHRRRFSLSPVAIALVERLAGLCLCGGSDPCRPVLKRLQVRLQASGQSHYWRAMRLLPVAVSDR